MILFLDNFKEIFSKDCQFPLVLAKEKLIKNTSSENLSFSVKEKNSLELKDNGSFFPYRLDKKVKVYFVVNKYNELVQVSSRLYNINSQKLKPIFFCFLSKNDAIDFLYKIAMSDPVAFKKTGLGINSFSLEKFKKISNKSKNISDMLLINSLSEIEALYSNLIKSYSGIEILNKKDIVGKQTINGILCYRIYEPSLSNQIFLTLEDVQDKWNEFITENSDKLRRQKICQIKVEFLSLEELKKI